jgi:hypothetical protein
MKKLFTAFALIIAFCSFIQVPTLKGTWIYAGAVSNGKAEAAPTDFTLQRQYSGASFEAFMLEKGEAPLKYQTGNYQLSADSCLETETFNIQSKALTGVTLHYNYTLKNDTLTLNGKLPNGNVVREYWVRKK